MHKNDPQRRQARDERERLSPGLIGFLVGLAIALLWVLFGFWRLLFILALSTVGYYIGVRYFRDRDAIKKLIDKIFPPGMFR
ncbi:MAG TPA: DUF2273 domain-containing protein [Clostridiaceae bacterium]|jgi:uncharacterized membrane protein|nr:DUF2273 domain-containing protein [Clostridiaceae bacterium]